jgi:membrane protein required for colicin V production
LTLFDIIALAVLGVSALVGIVRGALREITTVVALIAAGFAAVFALRFVGPMARAALHPAWLGNTAALLIIFMVVYVVLRIIGASLVRGLHQTSALGAVDRLVGGGLGLLRGLILLGVAYMAIHLAPPAAGLPGWITSAKLYPLSAKCAQVIRTVAPKGSQIAHRLTPEIEKAVKSDDGDTALRSEGGQSDETGYAHGARKGLDDVVEKTR